MGIWVVILEAVAAPGDTAGLGIEPGSLDDLTEELAAHYAVVTERPGAYETELWVEEGTAGAAILAAQRLSQAAVRFLGLPAWEVVRAEARDAHALETGLIDWPEPSNVGDETPEIEPPPPEPRPPAPRKPKKEAPVKKAAAKKASARKAPIKKAAARKAPARKGTARR